MPLTLTLVMAAPTKDPSDPQRAVHLALGKRLAELRQLRGLSQRELAERVGVVQVVVSNYEVAKLRITAEMALRLAQALDVPVQELLHTDAPLDLPPQRKPSRKVLERLQQIESLPRRKQDALLTTIDLFLKSAAS